MKSDIRIIRQLGTISDGKGNKQKELNIVSINNGPFLFDIREWSLDHTTHGDGIALNNDEARNLVAALQNCVSNDKYDVIDDQPSIELKSDEDGQVEMQLPEMETVSKNEGQLLALLKQNDISYTDKRDKNGALWIIGGHELDSLMIHCKELGFEFAFSDKGGRVTKGKPGWYLRATKPLS